MLYFIGSIFILVLFYSIYFGKFLLQKRRGIKTDQIGVGAKPKKVLVIETIMKIATYLVVIAEVLSIGFNWNMSPEYLRIIGLIIGATGVIIFFISVYTMKDSWRAGISTTDETKLVTSGIYKISRNPAFLGFDLVYIGVLLMYFSYQLLIFTLFPIVMLHLQILQEEKFLLTVFGEDYKNYKSKVFRYFGRKFWK